MDTNSVKRGALSCALAGTLALAGTAIAAEVPAEEAMVPATQEVVEAVEKPEAIETPAVSEAPEDADQGDGAGQVERAGQGVDAASVQDDGATEGAAPAEDAPAEEDYPFDWYYFDGSHSTGHSGAVVTLDETYAETAFVVPATVGGCPVIEVNAPGLDLTEIDVSACAGTLYKLACPDNYLEALDLSACEVLEILDCSNNLLEDLVLPARPVSVDCSENLLTKLVAWGNDTTMLNCSSNMLESLAYTGGFMLDCSDNMLKDLRFSGKALDCSNNLLESLDVALWSWNATVPTWLDCSNNQLTELDLSRCEYLARLDCSDNLLTELELGSSFLVDSEFSELGRVLNCQNNYIADTSALEAWLAIEGHRGQVAPQLEQKYPFVYRMEQQAGENALIVLGVDGDELVVPAEVDGATVERVEAVGLGLTSIDVSACAPNLKRFICSGNELASIDVSTCAVLDYFDCSDNRLTSIDIDGCPVLDLLDCSENQLTGIITFSGSALFCSNNQLTGIDAQFADSPSGAVLSCANNLIAELDTSRWGNLSMLNCADNLLEKLDTAPLADLWLLDCSGNKLTSLDISTMEMLGILYCENNFIEDTTVLEAWLAAEGHVGAATPQRDPDQPDAPETGAAELFDDVDASEWYVTGGYLDFVVSRGIMGGYTDADGEPTGLFGPHDPLTRAQAATVIYRLVMGPATPLGDGGDGGLPFSDVEEGQWYTEAVLWCSANGIVTGYTDAAGNPTGVFGTDDLVTREQLATMVWRLARMMGAAGAPGSDLSSFPDAGEISAYALDAMAWCNAMGIITGDLATGTPMLVPGGNALRCQTAKMVTVLVRDVIG